ncbi:hypothetical protein AWB68_06538 [Caballeronia choica]|uniref:Uncharacterized protein n=1 Tax=Caballeronia choica TaxID=326476 RepID=A0A158KMY5_9BURK|nr:hypothetical protein [Caballeronia choica]SAL82482.1 hypothetical protein AWB68_06538 [Caballeronia choica]
MSYIRDWIQQMDAQTAAAEQRERERSEAAARELEVRSQAEQLRRQRLAAHRLKVALRSLERARLRADTVAVQLERWWSALPPEQRSLPRAFSDIRAALHGLDIGTSPHNTALADALRAAGWRRKRDWRDREGGFRNWWYPPVEPD